MGQALYRKYRPRSFSEAVGQETVTKTLDEAVKSGRISHAYLFAGPRGVGKTSVARILAHRVNSLPYSHDDFHLDIIEIDAASNRRIDEIRDLREKVHITPTSAKYKVYIIDEAHMLTKEAFNALLKTLEEPPAHCIFILATTEAHKLPQTIISRTQRFNFKPIAKGVAQTRLQKIAAQEKIKIDGKALELLAEFGEGSLRDIIGLLDQLSAVGRQISEKEIRSLLGIPSLKTVNELLQSTEIGDVQAALTALNKLKEQAATPANISKALSHRLRQALIEQKPDSKWLTVLLKELVNVSSSTNPQETLEIAILEATSYNRANAQDNFKPPAESAGKPEATRLKKPAAKTTHSELPKKTAELSSDQWSELLKRLKSEAPPLHTALRLAKPSINGDRLNLVFPFSLHQKKAQEAKHIELISRTIEAINGTKFIVKCSVDKELAEKRGIEPPAEHAPVLDLKNISNIFGSAEVLES